MIKWLCYKIFRSGQNYSYNMDEGRSAPRAVIAEDYSPNMEKSIRFSVLPARGGCVFEIRTLDIKSRDWNTITHVIPEGADVAREVGSIVAMEMLRH